MPTIEGETSPIHRRRSARSTVLWGLASFVLLQLALTIAIDQRYPQLRDPEYGCRLNRLKHRTAGDPDAFRMVVLGSSRPQFGVRGKVLEEVLGMRVGRSVVAVNFAEAGAGCVQELFTLKRLLADGVRPDMVVIEVLSPFLAGQIPLTATSEERLPTRRLRHMDLALIEKYGASTRATVRRDWWVDSLVPWYTHRLNIVRYCMPGMVPGTGQPTIQDYEKADESGCLPPWWPRSPEESARRLTAATESFIPYLTNFKIGGPNVIALLEMLDICRNEQLPTTLLIMPEGPAFRKLYSEDARQQIDAYLAGLSQSYQIPMIDARDWLPEDQFLDSHHLHAVGAVAFTDRFAREALPAVLQLPPVGPVQSVTPALPSGPTPAPGDLARDGETLRR